MGISDLIASFLQDSLDTAEDGVLEVQRSELAQRFNCVPSQINYVMSTRFSPERGYIWLRPELSSAIWCSPARWSGTWVRRSSPPWAIRP